MKHKSADQFSLHSSPVWRMKTRL